MSAQRGPLVGFGNQTSRELGAWWSTGRWRRQAVAWSAILGGLFVLMRWALPALLPDDVGAVAATIEQTVLQFTEMIAIVTAIGVVLLSAGVIIDERQDGVLEWLLSKPLTRPALIAAKFTGHGVGLLVTVVVIPWMIAYLLLGIAAGGPWHAGRTLAAIGMIGLVAVFHLAFVLALSTFTEGRVAVLAIPLVLIVGADLVTAVVGELFHVLPWSLGRVAGAYLAEGIVVTVWPIVATVGWTALLLVLASWRLQRTEL
jgi:ABC-type transport system involved in multi-copper enzyme maturation permease subunit